MDKLRNIFSNRWFKFGFVTLFYILIFVVWSQIWWMLIGVIIIYDIYISKVYYRLYWGKHLALKEKNSFYRSTMGWIEAIIFAVIVASLIRIYFVEMYVIPSPSMEKTLLVGDYIGVSKVAYGPKLPNTPLSMPFVHNINPLDPSKKSYLEWIKYPYKRLAGLDTIKHNDVVVFNYPEGDTVMVRSPQENYYTYRDMYGKDIVLSQTDLMSHPVDKRDNYIKRAIGLPGNILEVRNGEVFIDGNVYPYEIEGLQTTYFVRHQMTQMSDYFLEEIGVGVDDVVRVQPNQTIVRLTKKQAEDLRSKKGIIEVLQKMELDTELTFPRDTAKYKWSTDNFGPLWIPRQGATVKLDLNNLPLYARVIDIYEDNDLKVEGEDIYINGVKSDSYTFKMNYFFMMGDNRHNSFDSRFFGFVPEDHIVGKASFIWFSKEAGSSLFGGIRFGRIFSKIK